MNQIERNKIIIHLEKDYYLNYRDPLWKDIMLSPALMEVIKTKEFQKLNRIKQLGPTVLVYPGAVHTRLCHSIGVYHLARKIILSLLTRGLGTFLTKEGIDDFLCASLLHDIGHFPYAHSLKELPLVEHERLATFIILDKTSELNSVLNSHCFNLDRICEILDFERDTSDKQTLFFRSLLSGALDPDKLDYLNRDAYFSGVTYGIQDSSYIINHLTIKNGRSALLAQAEMSLEHLLFAKYQMYKTVYWHEKTRCATAMIKKALIKSLITKQLNEKTFYNLDDYSFDNLAQSYPQLLNNVLLVRDNKLFATRYEESFNENNAFDHYCRPLEQREKIEEILYSILKKKHPSLREDQIIIDIPEPISFESDIPLVFADGSVVAFKDHDDLFTKDVRVKFIKTLRKTRIFTIEEITKQEVLEAVDYVLKNII